MCIKKLYQLLEKNERELELYRTGKKNAKNSFTSQINENANQTNFGKESLQAPLGSFKLQNKKSELHDILNTVYSKGNTQPAKCDTFFQALEPHLMAFIHDSDPKAFQQIEQLSHKAQKTNNSQYSQEMSEDRIA